MSTLENGWRNLMKKVIEKERKETYRTIKINQLIKHASDKAYDRLLEVPGATPTIINKIYQYTIYTTSLLNSDDIFNAYLPYLKKEIKK